MALIKCKECKNMISRDATICPHCGKPRPKNRPGCTMALVIVVILAIYGAISSTQESGKTASPSPAQSDSRPTAKVPAQAAPNVLAEPKWDERLSYWKNQLRESFQQPSIGQDIEVILMGGVVHRGSLKELNDQSVTIQIEKGTLTFDRTSIRQDSRLKLFSEDYVSGLARENVRAEQEAFRARFAAQEKAQHAEKIHKLFSAWDGSLYSLVQYTKKTMHDAKSFEHIETRFSDSGTDLTVWMKFRGKNILGALVINSITAKVDYEGNVISVLATEP